MLEAEEAATPLPLLFRVSRDGATIDVQVEFPYEAYECQLQYMQSVLDALFTAR